MKRGAILLSWLLLLLSAAVGQAQMVTEIFQVLKDTVGSKKSTAAAEPTPPSVPATLRWKNGESIPGEIVEASDAGLAWKTPLFEDPLLLDWKQLRRIDQSLEPAAPGDSFRAALRDGSHLYGELVSVTENAVTLRSRRHGDATLKRSEVLSVRRIKGRSLLFAGPTGTAGWKLLPARGEESPSSDDPSAAPSLQPLATGPGGSLDMPYWNRGATLALKLPDSVDIEFCVRSSKRPDFQLLFDSKQKKGLRIETWDNELVLAAEDEFKSLRKIGDDEREVALRLCWNRKTRRGAVFTPGGELIAEWQAPDKVGGPREALQLLDKGRDLSLDLLRVRAWDGKPPPKINVRRPRIELADGRVIQWPVGKVSAESLELAVDEPDAESTFPLADVDAIIFSTDSPKPGEQPAFLSYADGAILSGNILSIKDGSVALKTSFADAPLAARLEGLRQWLIKSPSPASESQDIELGDLDKIVIQQKTMHGRLTGAGDDQPRWLPVGGVRPATPARNLPCEFTRAFPPGAALTGAPALFYTSAGDVLPGSLRGLDRSGVEFESGFVETKKLAAADLNAVQFTGPAVNSPQDFDDAGWRLLRGNESQVKKTRNSLKMEPESSLGHPSAMQNSEIKFTFDPGSWTVARLRMFCAGTDPSRSVNLILCLMSNRFSAGLEFMDGQLENQTQLQATGAVAVRLTIDEKQVILYINGAQIQVFPIEAAKRAGSGLIIEPASIWGNSVNAISLSDFSAASAPGQIRLPDINAESKTHALTVPRFRKEDPPHNVILAANGDVLRGEIEAATATHFAFRSGLENFRVPRDRVRAAIWLKKPEETAAPSVEKPPILKLLEQKLTRRVRYSSGGLSSFVGVLQAEATGLKIKMPDKRDARRFPMQFGGQTVGEALQQVCELYGLSYRVDNAAGVVVLEAGAQETRDLTQKVYWLKADAFSKEGSAQEILAAKGIAFPEGAAALWQPVARQLSMTNTAANHEKLVKLLASDFGGNLGSPTHWLLLTSGARLGLIVDKFEKDSISGHHPVYGRCTAPMSQICVVRDSPPEPTAAMKSLEDWQLVYAPEPVLPETGGQSSPMLGKAAPTFKIPLLEGGDFNLDGEKGHVVVLDFWATWCGPCINALPGLIEAMSAFPADRVKLIGVNQSEPAEQVKRFLETRKWALTVAMDAGQNVARQYGVEGIPHTVIVGPDGKVVWVKTGYTPDGDAEAANAVKALLEPKPAAGPAASPTPAALPTP